MSKETAPVSTCYKCGAILYASLGLCTSCEVEQLQAELSKVKEWYDSVMEYGIQAGVDYKCRTCGGPVSCSRICAWCGDINPRP